MGKKYPANTPSHQPDYTRALKDCCVATILTVRCNATFRLRQLYTTTIHEDKILRDMPPDALTNLILEGQVEEHIPKEAHRALG